MNKKILFLVLLIAVLVLPSIVFGQTIKTMIDNAKDSLTGIGAALATVAFIVAGIMFLSATGNPSRMTVAKGALVAGVIGIVIIVLSEGAEVFVQTFFGLTP